MLTDSDYGPDRPILFEVDVAYTIDGGPQRMAMHEVEALDEGGAREQAHDLMRELATKAGFAIDPHQVKIVKMAVRAADR